MKQFLLLETNDARIALVDDGLGFQNFIEKTNSRVKFVNDYFSAIKFVTGGNFKFGSSSYFLIGRNNKVLGIVHTRRTRLAGDDYDDFQRCGPVSKDEAQRYLSKEVD